MAGLSSSIALLLVLFGIQLAGVHSDHRQRGVGTGLVQAGLEWAKSHRASAMQVVTQARNVPAQRLYQQMGFSPGL